MTDLLTQHLIVHLQPLGLLKRLLQALVGLAQLADVVAGLRQDSAFTLLYVGQQEGFITNQKGKRVVSMQCGIRARD